jgi:hypothetical protein
MTWTDITKNLSPEQLRTIENGVKKTGVCPRCKKSVEMWQPCPENLKAYPMRPSCPMKKEVSRSRGFPTKLD